MTRPGFILCLCPDGRLMRDQVETLLAVHPPIPAEAGPDAPGGQTWKRHVFWGDEPLPPAFWEALTLGGLFNAPRALIVHNAQNLPPETWKRLSASLAHARAHVWPFFCLRMDFEGGKPKLAAHIAKLPCFTFANKKGWLWSSPGLDARSQATFIRAEAQRLSLSLSPATLETLCRRLPLDAAGISAAMTTLALAATPDGVLSPAALDLVGHEPNLDIFALLRVIQNGQNPAAAWRQILASQQSSDSLTFSFLAMLSREARQLWQLLGKEPVHLPAGVLAAKAQLARSLGYRGITRIWRLALEADKGIKSGERSPDQALERLISELFVLFTPQRQR